MKKQWVVWVCFFFSGWSGLIYEVVWVRQFMLVFGANTYAVGAVLTAFMGGLSLGAWAGGRWSDRTLNPLKAYGLLELFIGLYAFLFPLFFRFVRWAYLSFEIHFPLSPPHSLFARFLASVLLLALPTALMGATLPFLSKVVVGNGMEAGKKVGRLYGVNTLGAVLGVLFSGFILIPLLGQLKTTLTAAFVNLILAIIALWMSRQALSKTSKILRTAFSKNLPMPYMAGLAAFLAALSGFSGMIYEGCYNRILTMTLGGSIYAFSTMLAVFLAGIGLGALAASWAIRFWRRSLKALLSWIFVAAGLTALASGFLFDRLSYLFFWLCQTTANAGLEIFWGQRVIQFMVSAAIMLPTAFVLGTTIPVLVQSGRSTGEKVGIWVGWIYSWNTLGAIAGSFLAAFTLIPLEGVQKALMTGVFFQLVAALILLVSFWGISRVWRYFFVTAVGGGILFFLTLLPPWNRHLLGMGPYVRVKYLKQDSPITPFISARLNTTNLVFYKEGVDTTVTVESQFSGGVTSLYLANNGKPEASTVADLPTQQLSADLPLLWFECSRRRPARQVALVGLASGISAGAALQHSFEKLTVIEIEPSMSQAASFFKAYNFDALSDPRLQLVTDDARHFLGIHPGQYDVICSEPSNPWISGISNLFTKECFESIRESLIPEGVFCQWVQAYEMKLRELKTIVRTFHSVFPYTYLFGLPPWLGKKLPPDLILVGSLQPLKPDLMLMDQVIGDEKLRSSLRRIGIEESGDLVSLLRLGPGEVSNFEGDGPLNSDDNALIEFAAPLDLYWDTFYENLMEVARFQVDPTLFIEAKPPARLKKLLLRVSSDLYPYWRRDLAVQWRQRAGQL